MIDHVGNRLHGQAVADGFAQIHQEDRHAVDYLLYSRGQGCYGQSTSCYLQGNADLKAEAIVNLPENQRDQASQRALAFPFGSPDQAVTATLRELSASADPTTRTYRARYVLHGPVERFALGSTITVRLQGNGQTQQTRVPIGALQDAGQGTGVWLIGADDRVSFAPVNVVSLGQEDALLDSGVAPGQLIVALGAHLLHSGDAVRLLPAQALALNRKQDH